jgi:hypothetical protein
MDVREFLDAVERAVLKSLDKTKDAVSEAVDKTADALEEMERKANRRERMQAIKESNEKRGSYIQAKRRKMKK